jgi:hypothetical protein
MHDDLSHLEPDISPNLRWLRLWDEPGTTGWPGRNHMKLWSRSMRRRPYYVTLPLALITGLVWVVVLAAGLNAHS